MRDSTKIMDDGRLLPPIYVEDGPVPAAVVSELSRRFAQFTSDPRRARQLVRHRILHSMHRMEIAMRIGDQVPSLQREISPHISVAVNPAADIVNTVAAVYNMPPQRKSDNQALVSVLRECALEVHGRQLAREAYFVGPVAVVPKVRRGLVKLEAIYPHQYEVLLSRDDPMGKPVAIVHDVFYADDGPDICVIDEESFRFYRIHGGHVAEEVAGMRVDHELGRLPLSILRFNSCHNPEDWWDAFAHERMVDGALDVGRIYATMGFIRRTQNKQLLTLIGNTDAIGQGQNLADDKPIVGRTANSNIPGSAVSIAAIPYDTDPTNFFKEIRFTIENMAESTGVPVTVTSAIDSNYDLQFDHDKLTELRDDLVWHAERFERDLWPAVVGVVAASDHELADQVPAIDEVMDGFSIEFGRLTRRFADPKQERDDWDWKISKGIKTFADAYRRYVDTFSTDSDAEKAIAENMEKSGKVWTLAAQHNAGMRPDAAPGSPESSAIVGRAQVNGALGPMVRDANKPPLDDGDLE